ncbi:MAG: HEAT repeat domain-containing protein [Armatimonadota bacterium]
MNDWIDPRDDLRSSEELVEAALRLDPNEETDNALNEYSLTVEPFFYRGTQDSLHLAQRLCGSSHPRERELGADILNHLLQAACPPDILNHLKGAIRKEGILEDAEGFLAEISRTLFSMLETEREASVLVSTAAALGHLACAEYYRPSIIPSLVSMSTHPHENVRYAVTGALWGIDDERAISTLLKLMTDSDADVRDWATFGIGTSSDADSPEIREALVSRLADEEPIVWGEALVGLAKRGDPRVVDALLAIPFPVNQDTLTEEALITAGLTTADRRLLPLLERQKTVSRKFSEELPSPLREWTEDIPPDLLNALEACRSGIPAFREEDD